MHDAVEMAGASFILFAIFVGIASPLIVLIICLFYYLKKRLEHQQIMAAIEKGTPLSDLKPVKKTGSTWIKSFTLGILFLIISLPYIVSFLEPLVCRGYIAEHKMFGGIIFFGLGLMFLIRGLLQRKAEKAQCINSTPRGNNTPKI